MHILLIRREKEQKTQINLLEARYRVTPSKYVSIPSLELMATLNEVRSGCCVQQLMMLRQWEDPSWPKDNQINWPSRKSTYDLKAVLKERRRTNIFESEIRI
ncbi:hypothetical protein CEXT_226361 [Caerostris extrusa]|uniref:Uncharacterized protein n=1 Tax=Caerostris extrusa TaxID=172846 RepID=A0AAV4XC00_CAEEX|nr:hypothetical protein CEXT_226361 [Caerostris extrusa]